MGFQVVHKAAKKPPWQDLTPPEKELKDSYRIARKHQKAFELSWRKAIRAWRDAVAANPFPQAFGPGDIEDIIDGIPWPDLQDPASLRLRARMEESLAEVYGDVIQESGRASLLEAGLPTSFALDNPFSIPWIREHSAEFLADVSESSRKAVRALLLRSFQEGITPAQTARDMREVIGLTERESRAVANRRAQLIADGLGGEALDKKVRSYADKLQRDRTLRIARTETITAEAQGLRDSWQTAVEAGDLNPGVEKVWIASTASERTCPICLELDGKTVPLNESFPSAVLGTGVPRPPAHVNCLPGDSLISAKGVSATSKRWYDGDLIILRTSLGNELACTPNHPILSSNGWVPASLLTIGDDVISTRSSNWVSARIDDDHEHVPAAIQKISSSFDNMLFPFSIEVPTTAQDFHGDGMESNVAVIRTDGLLRDWFKPSFLEKINQHLLCRRCVSFLSLARLGFFNLRGERDFLSSSGRMRSGNQPMPLIRRGVGHPDQHAFTAAPYFNAGFDKPAPDNRPADSEDFAESLLRHSSNVLRDQVININVQSFHGDVFNLETGSGYYIAEGIVTHNCRCTMGLVIE